MISAPPKTILPGLAAALLLLVPSSARPQAPAEGPAKAITLPFEVLPSNHMVLEAKLNGAGPYRLVFDVGAPITLLSNRAAEGAGIFGKGAPKSFLFAMRGEGKLKTLEVGELVAEGLPVIVLDHPVLKALAGFLGRPLDGIIGYTFFARYKTTIDYQAKRITFEPVDAEVRDLMRDLPERMMGPKEAKRRTLAPRGLWGLTLGEPAGGIDAAGVPVEAVAEGSAAAAAGTARPGEPVAVVVLRDGDEREVMVTPREGI